MKPFGETIVAEFGSGKLNPRKKAVDGQPSHKIFYAAL